jgi:hydrogenase nickel incorporation protein HypB
LTSVNKRGDACRHCGGYRRQTTGGNVLRVVEMPNDRSARCVWCADAVNPKRERCRRVALAKACGSIPPPVTCTTAPVRRASRCLGSARNNRIAAQNRHHFAAHGVTALNLVSSPGSGKTTLLVATIEALRRLRPDVALAVIEGDQQTSNDADRIRATGAPAIQVNTGKGCHLDAGMVADAFTRLPLHGHVHRNDHPHVHEQALEHTHEQDHPHDPAARLLFIENVGNLVCPALWDLGEAAKVAILSVTEGDDKPLKYPDMFAAARLMVLNKIDLLPHVNFDVARCIEYARRIHPDIEVLQVSATRGDGLADWLAWLQRATQRVDAASNTALSQRVAELEARLRAAGLPA